MLLLLHQAQCCPQEEEKKVLYELSIQREILTCSDMQGCVVHNEVCFLKDQKKVRKFDHTTNLNFRFIPEDPHYAYLIKCSKKNR